MKLTITLMIANQVRADGSMFTREALEQLAQQREIRLEDGKVVTNLRMDGDRLLGDI